MRTRESIKNTICSLGTYFFIIIVGFVSQRVFKDVLGEQYLGLHNLFSNIMSMLAIAELGFGSAIVVHMYEPVAKGNVDEIRALLAYYKKIYRYVAIVVLCIGLILLPFVDYLTGNTEKFINFKLVFLLYLADTVSSYFVTYKRSILYADQKSYYTNLIHSVCVIIMNLLQIYILLYTRNYFLYLIVRILFRFIENIWINILVNRKYSFIKIKKEISLNQEIKADIIIKVKGLLFHKIGEFAVLGSDNIIISMLPSLGLVWNGKYSNYLMITNQLQSICSQFFSAMTASVGNLLVDSDQKKNYSVFRQINLANTWISIFLSVCFYYISFPFVKIWMGTDFVFSELIIFILALNLYFRNMRISYDVFKSAAGIFYEDRYVPIIETVFNLLISVMLGIKIGLLGVLIGTLSSSFVLYGYSYPKFVHKKLFGENLLTYYKILFRNLFLFILVFVITGLPIYCVHFVSDLLRLCYVTAMSVIVSNICLWIILHRMEDYQSLVERLKKSMYRILARKNEEEKLQD